MMGPTHAASGAAAGIGTAIALSATGTADITAAEAAMMTGITAGAALIPDLDHPSATIARSFGPFSKAAAKVVGALSGGHRKGTHTLLGVAAFTAATWALVAFGGKWAALAVFFILFTFSMNSWLRPLSRKAGTLTSFGIAAAVTLGAAAYLPVTVSAAALATSVFVGGIVHILGDAVTHSGVPSPLAPILGRGKSNWGSMHVLPEPLRFSASGPMDKVLFALCNVVAIGLLLVGLFSPESVGVSWAPLLESNTVFSALGL